jgi:hypothetical protein
MSMNWTDLALFKGIDLNDSFVMGWSFDNNRLSFKLEASIWPESKYYLEPKKEEYTCYRKAVLEFVGVHKVSGLQPIDAVPSSTDPDGSVDYGNVDELIIGDGTFVVSGNFGTVSMIGGELRFEVHT